MTFLAPSYLWLLLLVPLTFLGLRALGRARRGASRRWVDDRLLPAMAVQAGRDSGTWTLALQLAALTALLLAAARPVASPPWPANRAAVVIAIDASRSMLADDARPSRLEAARALAQAFVRQAPRSSRIGLVSFSDSGSPLVLPTTDRDQLLDALAAVQPASDTSLTAAVVSGVRALPGRETTPIPEALRPPESVAPDDLGVDGEDREEAALAGAPPPARLLILSDGVDNVGARQGLPPELRLELTARFAADNDVSIYTVPVGQEGGAVTTIDGEPYFVPFDPAPLERLSEVSDGEVLDPEDERATRRLFRELGTDIRWQPTEVEVSALLAASAVVLLLVAGGLSLRWQRRVP